MLAIFTNHFRKALLAMTCLWLGQSCCALDVQTLNMGNGQAVVITVDPAKDSLHIFLADHKNNLYQSFKAINQSLHQQGKQLAFAMNAGMFQPDFLPVGLYVEHGKQLYPLNTAQGQGNFFMPPNGVFFLAQHDAGILSTTDFQQHAPGHIQLATQSGPLLVYQGKINTAFNPLSQSRYIRNAVGINDQQQAVFVISNQPVTFYELASFFKNTLNIHNALYLDGAISSLYLPALKRHDNSRFLGPIIGVTSIEK